MQQTTKQRTPSKCREWERQRRNKFNDAISKLGEVVKAINKANSNLGDAEDDTTQYPKIEIVQKAIICLTNYAQEKTQLKAEILALEVKLEAIQKSDKKDASIQVSFVNKKNQNAKYMKILKLQKSKQKTIEVSKPSGEKMVESKTEKPVIITPTKDKTPPKLPKLLPLSHKKGPESTLVMLPATPYIFSQRPLLFPTAPPTIVLVDTNLQPLNKPPPVSIINRNNTDITKTTMVNILPISAYSRPLSATKSRKNTSKLKNNNKRAKKLKSEEKPENKVSSPSTNEVQKEFCKDELTKDSSNKQNTAENEKASDSCPSKDDAEMNKDKTLPADVVNPVDHQVKTIVKVVESASKDCNVNLKNIATSKISEKTRNEKANSVSSATTSETIENNIVEESMKTNTIEKETSENKSKDTKLTNILEATICENVDGGNARLELAEELLAASPTAAFLMSFPLVSGNRADSPADEAQNSSHTNPKDNNLRRNEITPHTVSFFEKHNALSAKTKSPTKSSNTSIAENKPDEQKYLNNNNVTSKTGEIKTSAAAIVTTSSHENPFLNLPMPSLISTSCSLTDSSFGIEFDCNIIKTTPSQPTNYVNNSNIFYKSDPFNSVKNTIYSTSSISSGHDFNNLGLYPCAMEKYTSKKTDYNNVEDNLMKIGSSRLTYDIDLGWSHKSFDFVNCTTNSNTFNKDSILTSVANTYSSSYNPFNPDFHMPLVTNTNKKESLSKPSTSFPEAISTLYSQATNPWTDDVPTYNNPNISKNYSTKHNYHTEVQPQPNLSLKTSVTKHYELKNTADNNIVSNLKLSSVTGPPHQMPDTKKSPSKMHINWMTSEIRPMQNNCNQSQGEIKNTHKTSYLQTNHMSKKQDHNDTNYFPINMHNYSTQPTQEEFQVWPTARPAGTTEISIEPPPINLPTLVGDLALGPHDKKKTEMIGHRVPQADIQNCSSFLSVTQLMNRSTDNMTSRYYGTNLESSKSIPTKQNITNISETSRKVMPSRIETNIQPSYNFNDPKQPINTYENLTQFSNSKNKSNKVDKTSKIHKNNYSAEALIRGGTCSQKTQDNSSMKFVAPSQKYNDYTVQDSSVAQVSHFPPIIDYSDNNYTGQQFSGTTLYNSTTNTISNSFYSNFMPGGTNLMAGNYSSAPFSTDFIDYNQSTECNYTNHKYEELKMKNNSSIFHQDKVPTTYKSTRRESAAKHKLECSKKESSKKYQSKRSKLSNDVEEWNDTSHLLWQNKTPTKRHTNIISEDIPFPNYVGNQMSAQYQTDFFNSHLMSTNMQNMSHHNVDRSLASFPVTSRANFNLSTIFPEITMKVQ